MKKENTGETLLIPKQEWVPKQELQGDELKVMTHPIIKKAFNKILELYTPQHDQCLVSLCTSTRPYSKSRKWDNFLKRYKETTDCIICSNGGIIPIQFGSCYPYMTYDAHAQKKYDKTYIAYCYMNFNKFFNKFPYKKIIFNFRPNLRNRISAKLFEQNYKGHSDIYIIPSKKTYNKDRKNHFKPGGPYFPDLGTHTIKELDNILLR